MDMLQKEIQVGEHKLIYRTAGVGSKTDMETESDAISLSGIIYFEKTN
ncbi:hypothetical protein QUF44_04005 [Bacillus subtilis]|nr:hypothetical protein [Bacillus subtilis]MDM5300777.1 hypothetical protein [Bacillus subtilis]MDM5322830.1 hypothetical protein [Bacillus subtilis]